MQSTGPLSDREADGKYNAPRAALQISDFDIVGRIGDGSFSTVILAKLRSTGDEVAIKIVNKHLVLRNKMVDYVLNERNILDKLTYEGIVKLMFTFQDPDSLYFACEYCPGGDLYEQITQKGKLSMEHTRFYTAEIVLMLEYLRTKQVVHRDLKPENLLLTADGHLKLTDFGSARAFFLPATGGTGKQARATSFVGTAEYVSPEVLNNTPLSYPADLWALGSVIFQMLTGKPPFKAASEYLTFQKVAEREFEFPEDFSSVARDLVDALLVLEPEGRLGAHDVAELKAHPFFHGIDWDRLRQQEAPAHIPPSGPTPELEGLDWEVTSLVRDAMGPIPNTASLEATLDVGGRPLDIGGRRVENSSLENPGTSGQLAGASRALHDRSREGARGQSHDRLQSAIRSADVDDAGRVDEIWTASHWQQPVSHVLYERNPGMGDSDDSDDDSDGETENVQQ